MECSESFFEKVQRMIIEEGDIKKNLNIEFEWDDIEIVMLLGDKILVVKGQEIGFSSVKEFINFGLKLLKFIIQLSGSKSVDF